MRRTSRGSNWNNCSPIRGLVSTAFGALVSVCTALAAADLFAGAKNSYRRAKSESALRVHFKVMSEALAVVLRRPDYRPRHVQLDDRQNDRHPRQPAPLVSAGHALPPGQSKLKAPVS